MSLVFTVGGLEGKKIAKNKVDTVFWDTLLTFSLVLEYLQLLQSLNICQIGQLENDNNSIRVKTDNPNFDLLSLQIQNGM